MELTNLTEYLRERPYPGRGIFIGRTRERGDGAQPCSAVAYFIMGRSENSRNRVFEPTADGIRTRAFDESKMTDPSLIIYHPVRVRGDALIVTNGDQTDTIRDFLNEGKSFADALRTREFEPDGPNWTPRVSGLLRRDGTYMLSILKSMNADGGACQRNFYEYAPCAGQGHFISTYEGFGSPLPSFGGEPAAMDLPYDSAEALADAVWESLDADNRVSLFVQYIGLRDGRACSVLVNKHGTRSVSAPGNAVWRV